MSIYSKLQFLQLYEKYNDIKTRKCHRILFSLICKTSKKCYQRHLTVQAYASLCKIINNCCGKLELKKINDYFSNLKFNSGYL